MTWLNFFILPINFKKFQKSKKCKLLPIDNSDNDFIYWMNWKWYYLVVEEKDLDVVINNNCSWKYQNNLESRIELKDYGGYNYTSEYLLIEYCIRCFTLGIRKEVFRIVYHRTRLPHELFGIIHIRNYQMKWVSFAWERNFSEGILKCSPLSSQFLWLSTSN